jgi:aminoglycoside phosphotransferase (APT) family kinase protein
VLGVKLGAGREADVHEWAPDAVVKLYRPGFGGHQAEAQALAALDGHGVAPKLIDVVDIDGRVGLVLERLNGSDMLALLQGKPWRVRGLARALAEAHLAVHSVPAAPGLPDLHQVLATRIGDAGLTPQLRGFVLRLLDRLPSDDRLCHGDYHPGNVLVTADRIAVIDWAGAASGVPEADHARTLLLLRWADPLPGTPLLSRALISAGRAMLAREYGRVYAGGADRQLEQTRSWLVVHTAARLSEGIDVERPRLIGNLERGRRQAGQ